MAIKWLGLLIASVASIGSLAAAIYFLVMPVFSVMVWQWWSLLLIPCAWTAASVFLVISAVTVVLCAYFLDELGIL